MCDWCEGGACDLVYNLKDRFIEGEIDKETGIMSFSSRDGTGDRRVRFCPMCGRRVGPVSDIDRFYDELNRMFPGFIDFRGFKGTQGWQICKAKTGIYYMDDDELLKKLEEEYGM